MPPTRIPTSRDVSCHGAQRSRFDASGDRRHVTSTRILTAPLSDGRVVSDGGYLEESDRNRRRARALRSRRRRFGQRPNNFLVFGRRCQLPSAGEGQGTAKYPGLRAGTIHGKMQRGRTDVQGLLQRRQERLRQQFRRITSPGALVQVTQGYS